MLVLVRTADCGRRTAGTRRTYAETVWAAEPMLSTCSFL